MKHGDKNPKTAKAASQASGKKSDSKTAVETTKSGKTAGAKETGKESGKAVEAGKKQQAGPAKGGVKASAKDSSQTAGKAPGAGVKEVPPTPGSRRAAEARAKIDVRPREDGGFTNPHVGNAFKRAIKKYPNTFRRLTD